MTRGRAHLANLDLNLLVALRELIRERNVTRAAERIGITQPAASAALSRLRRHFGDELLVRGRGGYVPTPLAAQLDEQVEVVCAALERLFATGKEFNPETSTREFTLLMADYTVAVLGERFSRLVAEQAPRIGLHIRLVGESLIADATESIRLIDGVISPPVNRFRIPEISSMELFQDRWVCLVSADSPLPDAPDLDDLAGLDWVVPYHRDQGPPSAAPIPRQLALLGVRPRIAIRVESYRAVPHFLIGTNRIALLQERLATQFADGAQLRMIDPPGHLEPVVEEFWWHRNFDDDPAHRWLRETLTAAAEPLRS
ncbi:LysR family transcriptional regulator [Saccharopolyspora sp. K220]|uniref:LysR family transcriptional regulator n=1 Tax=Saccharopolyspora soli TaxID=2926618 RepID=UPI001F5895B0|nr:LysR family transcriptional regulator [Saccharopolyspora soli]MCI2416041.1 LysR family transcriptional regulator [Saccharopolyspora soli]